MDNMHILALTLLAVILTAGACQKTPSTEMPDNTPFSLSTETVEAGSEGGSSTITINSSEKVNIVGLCDWCKYVLSPWNEGKSELELTISENRSTESRSFSFSIICKEEKKVLTVNQAGREIKPIEENGAVLFARSLGMGWNLGNQMDAIINGVSSETAWGNSKCTQETFNGLKEKGFGAVRIPVTWTGHIGEAPEYKVDEDWLARVKEIAGYAHKAGLKAIVNLHHDEGWLNILTLSKGGEQAEEIKARYSALWAQIAEYLKDEEDWLMFEAFNELHDGSWGGGSNNNDGGAQYRAINELNQLFVNTVRKTGSKNADRYLGIPGYCTNPSLTVKYLELPEDSATDRLMVSIHYYDPSGFALGQNPDYTEWGHTGARGKKDPYHNEQSVQECLGSVRERFIDNNIPVYFGETGCVNRSDARSRAFQKYWMEYVYKCASDNGIAMFLWDNGAKGSGEESFGFIDHGNGSYINNSKEIIDVMLKALDRSDSSYTLETVYNSAP